MSFFWDVFWTLVVCAAAFWAGVVYATITYKREIARVVKIRDASYQLLLKWDARSPGILDEAKISRDLLQEAIADDGQLLKKLERL